MLSLALLATLALEAGPEPAPRPAERQFRAWLQVFNTGDRAALLGFLEKEYPSSGAEAHQQFRPVAEDGGHFRLVARHSGQCVEARASAGADAVPLEPRACDEGRGQSFRLVAASPGGDGGIPNGGSYRIVGRESGLCVEAAAGRWANGAPVRQAPCRDAEEQVWRLVETDSGYYRVQATSVPTHGWDAGGRPSGVAGGGGIRLWRNVHDVQRLLAFRGTTGGFEIRKVEESGPTRFRCLAEERDSDELARFTLEVEPDEPHRVVRLEMLPAARPPELAVPRLTDDELAAALRARLDADAAADRFSGAVMVARDGRTVFSGAFGLADRERGFPNTLSTRFRLGSMNKMFTATAVLQLVQAGKVRLDDPVGKLLPDYPNEEVAARVTVHHLLTHTGGTGDVFGPEFERHRLELRTLQDYVRVFGERGPAFPPGSRFGYSNYGMLVLGVIVETASGKDYYDYVRDHVFARAGMTRTGSAPEQEDVPGRAVGYTRRDREWRSNANMLPHRGTPAGGGYSTVEDLVRFAQALAARDLLDARHTELLTTGKVRTGNGGRYAYGFDETTAGGARAFGHGGGAPGMNGELRMYPESGYVVAVLSNLDPPAADRVSRWIANRLPVGRQGRDGLRPAHLTSRGPRSR
jgi:D-alanyl-D-alanine carboxypeptidase